MYTRDVDVDVAKSYMWLLANLLWMYLLTLVNALGMNLRSVGKKNFDLMPTPPRQRTKISRLQCS